MNNKKKKEKSFLSRNLPKKKRYLAMNTGLMTSILGISGPELHSFGTEAVTFFGAHSLLGRAHFSFGGGTSSDFGVQKTKRKKKKAFYREICQKKNGTWP